MIQDSSFDQSILSLGIPESRISFFYEYINILLEWNQNFNLIGKNQDIYRLLHLHVLDSLLVYPLIDINKKFIDVGTGAGFPGLVWALANPSLSILLVERNEKKCKFLEHVINHFNLIDRVALISKTAEQIRMSADIVTSRAVTQTANFLELTKNLGHSNTVWWLLKATREAINEELKSTSKYKWDIEIKKLIHPTQNVQRHLLECRIRQ